MSLKEVTVAVTGAAGGIGRALVETLAEQGATVAAIDVDAQALTMLTRAVESAAGSMTAYPCDLTSDDDVAATCRRIESTLGVPSVVINNAALTMLGSADALVIEDWRRALDVNVLGYIRVMKGFIPGMTARGSGRFVNVVSAMGITPDPIGATQLMPYVASKAADVGLSQAMAVALAPKGIVVSVFVPAITDTWTGSRPGSASSDFVDLLEAVTRGGVSPQKTAAALLSALATDRFLLTNNDLIGRQIARLAASLLDPRGS